ncbi:DUF896 domain-containing protein [Lactobacillus sp. S2-2]|uniref:DUF896 domain-containing protein n=1 Tax=Lactobacillus sp. S2-2 TaxID=2692917 RepID=UPI001F1CA7BE|nr:DUF896 domain-containing protein [Lactobacillus sp. S2-2]MCF6514932.1 DUF896 domain-containing protein [Lactobacillus sp. S2-2]
MADDPELLNLVPRINELAAKAKETELSNEEKQEQKDLREKYVKRFKQNLKSHLDVTKVYDKDGNEVTSEKAKKSQRENGLRDD